MPTSPNVLNYSIPKGIVYFTPDSTGTEQDLGNCPSLTLTPDVEELEHVSSRSGISSVDRTLTVKKTMTGNMILDEITPYNLNLALLGDSIVSNSESNSEFGIFANASVAGRIRLVGQGDIGNRINLVLPSVTIKPSAAIPFIGDDIQQLELEFTVNFVEAFNDFGTIEVIDATEVSD